MDQSQPKTQDGNAVPFCGGRQSLSQVKSAPKYSFAGRTPVGRGLDIPGPGAYGSTPEEKTSSKSGASPRGYGFGTMQRMSSSPTGRPSTAPGPGSYLQTTTNGIVRSKSGGSFGTSSRSKTNTAAVKQRCVSPGPGSYAQAGSFSSTGTKMSNAGRFGSHGSTATPGPGAYVDPSLKTTTTRHAQSPRYGFGSSPRNMSSPRVTPGPGAYQTNDTPKRGPQYSMSTRRGRQSRSDGVGVGGA